MEGYYSYPGSDGKIYTTHYTADNNGYRATSASSYLPILRETSVQPLPFVSSTSGSIPYISSTPVPVISSTSGSLISNTPAYFGSSTPATYLSPSPFNVPPTPSYRELAEYSSTTPSPIVSSSTPLASTVLPFSRPHFPIYAHRGYSYTNPRINSQYSVMSHQTPAPTFFPFDSRILTTVSIPNKDIPVQFKQYIPPSSTPRPFDNFSPNYPNIVLITPKPSLNQPTLPNSLSVKQDILPPILSVASLNSPQISVPSFNTNVRETANFINSPLFDLNDRVGPQTVAPLTVTNLNFRKKRNN